MSKPWIYIASPYTKGDPAINAHVQCKMFDRLMREGRVFPFAPLVSHFQHTVAPLPYAMWLDWDFGLIPRLDACLRINCGSTPSSPELNYLVTESSGADKEVALFQKLGKPVFYSVEELYDWYDRKAAWDEKHHKFERLEKAA